MQRNGVTEQLKRRAFIPSLLQVTHFIVGVNILDLVSYSEDVFRRIVEELNAFWSMLDIDDVVFVPISALKGGNVVGPSKDMPWYPVGFRCWLGNLVQKGCLNVEGRFDAGGLD